MSGHVAETWQMAGEVAEAADRAAGNSEAVAAACQELTACSGEISRYAEGVRP